MKKYDLIVIGLGPAGMAVSVMGTKMGLKVLGIEQNKIGGECMNTGCVPSKGILKLSEKDPSDASIMPRTAEHVKFIGEKKVVNMFKETDTIIKQGPASFIDPKTIKAGGELFTAKYIFIAAGTVPSIPPVKGIENVNYLTNETVFDLSKAPESIIIIGGGAMGTEMATAFARMGSKCTIVHNDPHLLANTDEETAAILQAGLEKQGITVYNGENISEVSQSGVQITLKTESGKEMKAEKLLIAAGKKLDISALEPEKAGIKYTRKGITVDKYLRTNKKHIFAVGDCNGYCLLSHAAMHQGMIALINALTPWPFKQNFKKFPIPWTVFSYPEAAHTGKSKKELDDAGIKYITITEKYTDFPPTIAEEEDTGYVKVYASKLGKIYGTTIIGMNAGEMINEWTLAIQNKTRLFSIMMTMHSFPTMGIISKKIGEAWMMNIVRSGFIRKIIRFCFKI